MVGEDRTPPWFHPGQRDPFAPAPTPRPYPPVPPRRASVDVPPEVTIIKPNVAGGYR